MALTNSMEMKELTDNGLMEIAGLTSRREYNLSLVKSRQLAEQLVKSYAEEKNIEYTALADTIEALFQNGCIDRTSRDAFHSIRVYGNKAVHEGDNDAEDAQKAYYLLKNEVQTYMSHKSVSVDRTPVRVDRNQVSSRRPAFSEDGNAILGRSVNGREVGQATDQQRARKQRTSGGRSSGRTENSPRSGSQAAARRSTVSEPAGGFSIYDLLRILIPVLAVILLVIIIRSLLPSKKPQATTTAPSAAVETTAEEETPEETEPETEATTEAPKSFEYRIKGNGVNIRYADNQDRVYTQLSNGTAIGTVEPIEGSDFVKFTLDGISVVVHKDYIEPAE